MVRIHFEYGVLIRKAALSEKSVQYKDICSALGVDRPDEEDDHFLSFGPHFGPEAVEVLTKRLTDLGLDYWDDFFETSLDHPEWCIFNSEAPQS